MILSLALNYVLVPPSTGHFSTQDVLRGTMREKIIQFCNLKSDIKPPNETNLMLHKVESARDKNAGSIKRRTAIRHKEQSLTQLLHKAKSPAVGEGADPCQESHTRLSQKTTIHKVAFTAHIARASHDQPELSNFDKGRPYIRCENRVYTRKLSRLS